MPRMYGPAAFRKRDCACCRKSLICIRPVDRLAGRGLDGNTHAPLISLADRLTSNHLGHQILGASHQSVPCSFSIANSVEARLRSPPPLRWVSKALSLRRTLQAMRASLLARATASLLPVQPLGCCVQKPCAEAEARPVVRTHQEDLCGLDQQASAGTCCRAWRCGRGSIGRLCCTGGARGRARRQSRARGQMPRRCRSQRPRRSRSAVRCRERSSDAGTWLRSRLSFSISPVIGLDALVQAASSPHRDRRSGLAIRGDISSLRFSNIAKSELRRARRSSPDGDALLDQKGADLIDRRCPPRDQAGPNAMTGLQVELVLRSSPGPRAGSAAALPRRSPRHRCNRSSAPSRRA